MRLSCKRWVLRIVVSLCVIGVIAEIALRVVLGYQHPLVVVNCELLLVGVCLVIMTIAFIKLQRKVFRDEFEEEQNYFLVGMIVFLATYTVRWLCLILIMSF